ncbi:MAG: hypothetical protein JWP88_1578 [Flaviaesturariibacter sp.]|nr:hypothetical protein [Flaviaesturariibacter sp.]
MAQTDDRAEQQPKPIPETSTTKPMDSKQDVEKSPDQKTDQDFPGYPHYPAKEDMMDKRTDSHRVDVNVEDIPNSKNITGVSQRFESTGGDRDKAKDAMTPQPGLGNDDMDPELNPRTETGGDNLEATDSEDDEIGLPQNVDNDDLDFSTPTEGDVTEEEKMALRDSTHMPTTDENNLRQARLDDTDFDGEKLNEESAADSQGGGGLDIPDEMDETETESMGQGDEENKYYSLGGDRHEAAEEDPYSDPDRSSM